MELIREFFSDYTLQIVLIGSAILGFSAGTVGTFALLKGKGLLGDMVSHASLPGIVLAFLFTGIKDTEVLLLGALMTGLLSVIFLEILKKYTKLKYDSLLAIILSGFFGIGITLLTYVQKIPNANQAGLDKFIFGQASTLVKKDVSIISIVSIICLTMIILFWKEIKLYIFDEEYAITQGFHKSVIEMIISFMMIMIIIVGLQTVGAILISSLLIAPGVASRQWTDKLSIMVVLSGVFGIIGGVSGTIISSAYDKMPTGPLIVVIMTIIALFSIVFSPKRGILFRNKKLKRDREIFCVEGGE
ncbi:zinc transport system membrane protein TroC [Gottschalkia purinilytica]|uniref:Zinc transport system membrane protein TroC n=1 Tax=Gottschalkia purinilytica TaxID=1503 RepID=A0A0L0WAX5_GOTPU|nr:metal ABC transporter permease [Gottschalkia purinilytica]KNF08607.1 zinc transport system membrane protein TroC [Gottschalkia purinilytica]